MFNVQNPENPESSILETKNKTLSLDFPLPIILNHYNEVILVYVVFFPGTPQHVDGGMHLRRDTLSKDLTCWPGHPVEAGQQGARDICHIWRRCLMLNVLLTTTEKISKWYF